jgi:uncharacterized protein
MFESLIFTGTIRHRRFRPKQHQFSYKLFMFYFDINNLTNSFKNIKHVSIERFNWFTFRRKNYLSHSEIPLDDYVRQLVFAKFNTYPKGKVYLLTNLSCLGYCFNPISLYFIFDETNQQLEYLILEVTNTPWGEKHNYVLANSSRSKKDVYNFQFQKELHVSPFMTMYYEYKFNLKLNQQKIIVHMENHIDGKKDFDATLILSALAQKETAFRKILRHYPLITYKVALAIYWQALKLWIKGIPFHAHPKADKRK